MDSFALSRGLGGAYLRGSVRELGRVSGDADRLSGGMHGAVLSGVDSCLLVHWGQQVNVLLIDPTRKSFPLCTSCYHLLASTVSHRLIVANIERHIQVRVARCKWALQAEDSLVEIAPRYQTNWLQLW